MTTGNWESQTEDDVVGDVLSTIARAMMLIVAGLAIYGQIGFELAVIVLLLLQPAA